MKGSPLDKELIRYYEETFGMLSTQGWAYLLEDFQKIKESVNTMSGVTNVEELYFRKGQLDIIELILNRKKTCEQVYEELKDEQIL